ncbi:MAG: penicillin-binding protein 1A [Rhizobiaceae bacterium]|nr:penicillin-binding protein 1A [Rhizobiaceae bacterium]
MFFKIFGYLFGIGILFAIAAIAGVGWYVSELSKDLPDFEVLNAYEPPVTTRIHASDGDLMAEYARQRRLYLPIQAMPELIKAAFLSAEDKNFYKHFGIDPTGLARAVITNIRNYGSGRRAIGASTITQQVAKNFLLSNERSIDRKIKEAILSLRIEQAYSKNRILELYLNEIFLGLGAYGVAGASLTYFDKAVQEIELHEAAYLAALPKAPNNYHPFKHTERAIIRRNWVIDRMVQNGYVSFEEGEKAKAHKLEVNPRRRSTYLAASEYFSEEVRREIVTRYGETALYEGGLSIRTTLDPKLQIMARKALMDGLVKFDIVDGYRGAREKIELGNDWGLSIAKVKGLSDVPEWKLAVILSSDETSASFGIKPKKETSGALSSERKTGRLFLDDMKWAKKIRIKDEKNRTAKKVNDILEVGDVIFVEAMERDNPDTPKYRLRQKPKVSGAFVAMDPHTGRVLAMVGGFSFADSQFNRATQAYRQPGSSFKPFVYAAALDNGYSPSSVVLDAPIKIDQGGGLGFWEPKNYGGKFAGPSTLRRGIEKSRNLMTVRLAKDMGMPLVAEYAQRFGIYDKMLPVLAMSLGSGETTVMRMVSAYSVLANGGKQIRPSLIDRIQDRYGKTIFKHEARICADCNAQSWQQQEEPVLDDTREQVLDPMTAYQITSMMEGVVQRGTARVVRSLNVPVAGKTGTTNDYKDAWFVGYTPDMVAGLYIGYDTPKPMGRRATGGGLAAPIFTSFMSEVLEGKTPVDFRVPNGLTLYPINAKTGLEAPADAPGIIMEAFKPGTRPPTTFSVIGFGEEFGVEGLAVSPDANRAVISGTGGLF